MRRPPGRGLTGCLAVLLCVTVASTGCGSGDSERVPLADRIEALDRVDQDGFVLGSASAAAELTIYARPTDYGLALFLEDQLPTLLASSIESGQLRLALRTVDAREDDRDAARLLHAVGLKAERFWQALVSFGDLYSGLPIDDAFAREVLRGAGVIDPTSVFEARTAPRIDAAITRATGLGRAARWAGKTRFVLRRGNEAFADVSALADDGDFADKLNQRLAEAQR